jgi:hypothetical protein
MKILVVLTQYRRNHLEKQLIQIYKQSIKPDYLVVFQNENHVDITNLKNKYNFFHIKSDYNTKYFGRFAACFTFPVDICMIFDDDIIPGIDCIKNYTEQCIKLNSIIGGNGRIGYNNINKQKLKHPNDTGFRNENILVDFVGHLWCFKKDWLHYMFSIKPFTYDTGEDIHLCYSSKILGNINSYTSMQKTVTEYSDITNNSLASDEFSSYKNTSSELRKNIEKYFLEKYNLKLITSN